VPLLVLIAIFVVIPLAELYVLLEVVGPALGAPLTIALLVADSLAGAWLMKSQGRVTWARFNATLREGRIPAREIVDGVLIIFGGAFLITPGFITDVLGFLLLIPLTRRLFRGTLQRRLALRAIPIRRPSRYDYDVEGTASEHYEPPPPSAELPPAARSRRPRT
jgi:UPF0716 protein FxsA